MIESQSTDDSTPVEQPIFLDPQGRRRIWLRMLAVVTAGGGVAALATGGLLFADHPSSASSAIALPVREVMVPEMLPDAGSARAGQGGQRFAGGGEPADTGADVPSGTEVRTEDRLPPQPTVPSDVAPVAAVAPLPERQPEDPEPAPAEAAADGQEHGASPSDEPVEEKDAAGDSAVPGDAPEGNGSVGDEDPGHESGDFGDDDFEHDESPAANHEYAPSQQSLEDGVLSGEDRFVFTVDEWFSRLDGRLADLSPLSDG